MAEQTPSIRETLDATLTSYENDSAIPVQDTPAQTGNEQTQAPAADAEPSTGDYLSQQQPEAQPAQPADQERQPGVSIKDTPPQVSAKLGGQRGPVSWKPEVRAKWDTLPVEVKAEVIRREREIQSVMQESADARTFAEHYFRTIQPYQQLIALESPDGNVLKVFGDYLRTAAALRNGTPMEKATAVASAIRQYGIDVQALDTVLSQMVSGQHQPQSAMPFNQLLPQQMHQQLPQQQQQFRDPRMDQLLEMMRQQQAQHDENTEVRLETEIDQFGADPKNQYFEVLRGDMATILATGADMGRKISLRQAYDLAANMHPDVSRAIRAQRAGPRVVTPTQRAAGSSITATTPRQTGDQGAANNSVRSSIEQAISQLGA